MFRTARKQQLQVPGHPDYLPDLREFVRRIGKKYHLPKEIVKTFMLAVDEAATNIIRHGGGNHQSSITVRALIKRKSVTFTLVDQGTFFDPEWAEEPDLFHSAESGQRPHLGIFLLRKMIDKIEYVRTGAGNELRLTKYRKANKAADRPSPKLIYFLVFLTVLIVSVFFYKYTKVDGQLRAAYLDSGQTLSNEIVRHVSLVKSDALKGHDGWLYLKAILESIYEDNVWKVYDISVVDTNGMIVWSTKSAQISQIFSRPDATSLDEDILTYTLNNLTLFEFHQPVIAKQPDRFSGEVYIRLLKKYLEGKIELTKWYYLRNVLLALGIGYVAIALLGYIFESALHKFSRWAKTVGQRLTFDPTRRPITIDSKIEETPDNSEKQNEKTPAEHKSKPQKSTLTEVAAQSSVPNSNIVEEGDPTLSADNPENSDFNSEALKTTEKLPKLLSAPEPALHIESKQGCRTDERLLPEIKNDLILGDFLDRLNSKVETTQFIEAAFNEFIRKQNSTSELDSQKIEPSQNPESVQLPKVPEKTEPEPETEPIQTSDPEPSQEAASPKDTFEKIQMDDISDSLVDSLFDTFAAQVDASDKIDSEANSVTQAGLTDKDECEADPQPSARQSAAEDEEKPDEESTESMVAQSKVQDFEIEADSILVESIEDLLAKAKKVHSLISKHEQAPDAGVTASSKEEKTRDDASTESMEEAQIEQLLKGDHAVTVQKLMSEGIQYCRNQEYENAIIAFRNTLKLDPDSKNSHLLLGNAYFKNGMLNEALTAYEQLKKKHPDDSIIHENLGLIYSKKGIPQLAIKEWKAALMLNPDRIDIKIKINNAVKALQEDIQDDDAIALEKHDFAKTHSKTTTGFKNNLEDEKTLLLGEGVAHYRKKDFEAAIKSFEATIKAFPDFKEAYSFLGITYFRNKMFARAKQTFEKLQQLKIETASTYENMGLIYAHRGSYREALNEWKKVLSINPHRTDIKEKINQVVQHL